MVSPSDLRPAPKSPNIFLDALIGEIVFRPGYTIFYTLENARGDTGSNGGRLWGDSGAAAAFAGAAAAWEAVCAIEILAIPFAYQAGQDRSAFTWVEEIGNIVEDGTKTLAYHDLPGTDPGLGGRFNNTVAVFSSFNNTRGGLSYATFVHEIGHGIGLVHPHGDVTPGEPSFPGVNDPFETGSNELNQSIFTTMSYNDGYDAVGNPPSFAYGWPATPMAFDIAAVQLIYGPNLATGAGSDRYELPKVNAGGTTYMCIWDAGGDDTIFHTGAGSSTIDLRAATLRDEVGGGGFVSKLSGIFGGVTIANGVVIENATGGTGSDAIIGNDAANRLDGGSGDDRIEGGSGADTLIGGAGADTLDGGEGADLLQPGDGLDVVDGGAGLDIADYSTATAGKAVALADPAAFTAPGYDRLVGIEAVVGSAFADRLTGSSRDDVLDGGSGGADILDGSDGVDTLTHAASARGLVIDLGSGITWDGQSGDSFTRFELIVGSSFYDEIYGDAFANLIDGGGGSDLLAGGGGIDTVSFATSTRGVVIDVAAGQSWDGVVGDRFSGFENALGSALYDEIYGDGFGNVIDGGGGADLLSGGGGADLIVLRRGETEGDMVMGFSGAGGERDLLLFTGFAQGSTLTALGAGAYAVTDGSDGLVTRFQLTGSPIVAADYLFG